VQRHALFFTDPDSRKIFKDHVKFLINRNNSINGCVNSSCIWSQDGLLPPSTADRGDCRICRIWVVPMT